MVWIIMGVSGSGKTTIGKLLAERSLGEFFDADHFHPPENVAKMHSGTPLNDSDRLPWLRTLANEILHWQKQNKSNVLACSALKDTYRQLLDPENKCQWVYLRGDKETIRKRMQERPGHFMPPKLLDSQFETLEEPKNALSYDILLSPEEIVENIIKDSKS